MTPRTIRRAGVLGAALLTWLSAACGGGCRGGPEARGHRRIPACCQRPATGEPRALVVAVAWPGDTAVVAPSQPQPIVRLDCTGAARPAVAESWTRDRTGRAWTPGRRRRGPPRQRGRRGRRVAHPPRGGDHASSRGGRLRRTARPAATRRHARSVLRLCAADLRRPHAGAGDRLRLLGGHHVRAPPHHRGRPRCARRRSRRPTDRRRRAAGVRRSQQRPGRASAAMEPDLRSGDSSRSARLRGPDPARTVPAFRADLARRRGAGRGPCRGGTILVDPTLGSAPGSGSARPLPPPATE